MVAAALEPGRIFDDFLIEDQIGVGGQGIVYRARQLSLDRVVAIKMLGAPSDSPAEVRRFKQEAITVARLNHENIAKVHYIGQNRACQYLVEEFVDGITLRTAIQRMLTGVETDITRAAKLKAMEPAGRISAALIEKTIKNPTVFRIAVGQASREELGSPTAEPLGDEEPALLTESVRAAIESDRHVRRCVDIIVRIAEALHHAHDRGVLHLDIKPENIMVSRTGEVRLIDFGLSRILNDESRFFTSAMRGTPHYLAPEQLRPRDGIDARAEQFSLGLVLYELLTLRRAIAPASVQEAMFAILSRDLVPIRKLNPVVPEALARVVHKATSKAAADRYPDMKAFGDDLRAALAGGKVAAPRYHGRIHDREIVEHRPSLVLTAGWYLIAAGSVWMVLAALVLVFVLVEGSSSPDRIFVPAKAALIALLAIGAGRAQLSGARSTVTLVVGLLLVSAFLLFSSIFMLKAADTVTTNLGVLLGVAPALLALISLRRSETRAWQNRLNELRESYAPAASSRSSLSLIAPVLRLMNHWSAGSRTNPPAKEPVMKIG
jgi:hypothetical protein